MSTEQTIAALWEQTFGVEALDAQGDSKTFFQVSDDSELSEDVLPEDSGITLGACIGKGGFADVFSARQHSLRREVAVKQIREQSRGDYLRFFHHEVWLTAGLNHPNILPIHDLVRIDGCPSLVMKRVNGEAWDEQLTEAWSNETTVLHHEIQRLVDVCDAIAFAHSRGVLHLDLKPANVMCGAFGETLVMDWGCAALFDDRQWSAQPDLPRTSKITKPFGTPAFMAPELARGEGSELGPHSDIYLLGAILHLLLSGSPLRMGMTVRSTIEMAAQGERQPLPETAPIQLADLCRHATESEIAERLCDLSVFRDTLQHWLDTRESQVLTERALETLSEMEKAETLTTGQRQEGTQLLGVFEQAGRSGMKLPQAIEGEWRMRGLLAQTALKNGEPGVARVLAIPMPKDQRERIRKQAQALQTQQSHISNDDSWLYRAMSHDGGRSSETALQLILQTQEQTLGERHHDTLRTIKHLAILAKERGKYPEAESLYLRSLGVHRKAYGDEHPLTLQLKTHLANLYKDQGRYKDAESLYLQNLDVLRRTLGSEHSEVLHCTCELASLYSMQARYTDAHSALAWTLKRFERDLGVGHPRTMRCQSQMAKNSLQSGKLQEAEALVCEVMTRQESILGMDHIDTLNTQRLYMNLCLEQGKYEESERLLNHLREVAPLVMGSNHPLTINIGSEAAGLFFYQGRLQEARDSLSGVVESLRDVVGSEHHLTINAVNTLVVVSMNLGRFDEAEDLVQDNLRVVENVFGTEHPDFYGSVNTLGSIYFHRKQYSQAEELFRRAFAFAKSTVGSMHPMTLTFLQNIATTCSLQSKHAESEDLHLHVFEMRMELLGPEHPDTLVSLKGLGESLYHQDKFEQAEKRFTRLYRAQLSIHGEMHVDTQRTRIWMANAGQRLGKIEEAIQHFRHAVDFSANHYGVCHLKTLNIAVGFVDMLVRSERRQHANEWREQFLRDVHLALGGQEPTDEQAEMLQKIECR